MSGEVTRQRSSSGTQATPHSVAGGKAQSMDCSRGLAATQDELNKLLLLSEIV